MLWPPTANVAVMNAAWPKPLRVPVPIVLPPSLNVTVPEGMPEPGALAVTVAVNVTDWPKTVGMPDVTTTVVVLSWLTVWPPDNVPALAEKIESPEYSAVMM